MVLILQKILKLFKQNSLQTVGCSLLEHSVQQQATSNKKL